MLLALHCLYCENSRAAYFRLGHLSKTHAIYLCICWTANTQGKIFSWSFHYFVFQFWLLNIQHAIFFIIQRAPGFNHIDNTHNKTDSQANADPSDITWSTILYMWINRINLITCKMVLYIFFPLTDVLHHDRVMMEGKMNLHWHMLSCITVLNIEDIHQKSCHAVIYFDIYLSLLFLKTKLRLEHNFRNEFMATRSCMNSSI